MRLPASLRAPSRVPLLQVVKTSVATVAAWFVAVLVLPSELPIFAAIAALLVVQPSVNQSFGKAIERSVGVIAGVLIASLIGLVFNNQSWVILLAIVVSIFFGWLFRLTPGSANQIPISAMLVLAIGAATPGYAIDRIIETLIGAALGVIVNVLIVPPVVLAPAERDVNLLAQELAASLERLARSLTTRQSRQQLDGLMIEARLLRPMRESAEASVRQGEESLTLNPRQSAHRRRLEHTSQLLARLSPIVTRVIGMTRALHDHYDPSLHEEPALHSIASELGRAAHDLRLLPRTPFGDHAEVPGAEPLRTAEIPVLTAPLTIARPHPEHWLLIGSLMEDLRRIHEEIVGD
ncbi:FUSC family protein [Mycetocola sp. CAN_C7]|uniref:FUSC family protein n=1 Tax=Mycetocola sp. CAN_C7 TaxID=2787724 RepID=UPI0018CBAB37